MTSQETHLGKKDRAEPKMVGTGLNARRRNKPTASMNSMALTSSVLTAGCAPLPARTTTSVSEGSLASHCSWRLATEDGFLGLKQEHQLQHNAREPSETEVVVLAGKSAHPAFKTLLVSVIEFMLSVGLFLLAFKPVLSVQHCLSFPNESLVKS